MARQAESLKRLWETGEGSESVLVDDSAFQIAHDFETLGKIRDILEELKMLTNVARQQRKSLGFLASEEVRPFEKRTFDYATSHKSHSPGPALKRRRIESPPKDEDVSPSRQSHAASEPLTGPATKRPRSSRRPSELLSPANSDTVVELLDRADERESDLKELTKKAEYTCRAVSAYYGVDTPKNPSAK